MQQIQSTLAKRTAKILMQDPVLSKILFFLQDFSKQTGHCFYLAAGCIAETIFNKTFQKPIHYGIKDIDLMYYNPYTTQEHDKAWETLFQTETNSPFPFDIKNQYYMPDKIKTKYNIDILPYKNMLECVTRWSLTATSIIITMSNDTLHIHAPYGLMDMHKGILRPAPKSKPPYFIGKTGYDQKVASLTARWPELTVREYTEQMHITTAITYYEIPIQELQI